MGVMSIREFNQNVSEAFARVEAGEHLTITKNGKVVAEVSPKSETADSARTEAVRQMIEGMERGIPGIGGPASYQERTD